MRPRDTAREADALQLEILRRLDGLSRLRSAVDMSLAARTLALARLRQRYPHDSDRELNRSLLRLAFPPDALPPPLR
jgi:hypothetical protein